jgi:hypothetical protein
VKRAEGRKTGPEVRPHGRMSAGRRPRRRVVVAALLSSVLLSCWLAGPAPAVSLWGAEGLGKPDSPYDIAARGSGGTAIGVCDPFGMSAVNPAVIAWAGLPQASFGLIQGTSWTKASGGGGSSRLSSLDLTGGRLVLPMPYHLSLGVGYRGLLDGGYQVQRDYNAGREDAFLRTIKGTGGVGELSGTLALRDPRGVFAAGLQIGFAGGTLRDQVEDLYQSSGYANSKYLLRTRLQGGRSWTLGLQGQPRKGHGLGAFYRGKTRFDVRDLWTSASRQAWDNSSSVDLPEGMGGGISALVAGRHRLALDLTTDSWDAPSSVMAGQSGGLRLCDAYHLGLGYSLLPGDVSPKDPVLARAVWRAGVSWSRLPVLQNDGAKVEEWILSGGVGLPVKVDRGYLNGLLELGRTGSLGKDGVREVFVRVGLGVTFGKFPSEF